MIHQLRNRQNKKQSDSADERSHRIVFASIIGVLANILFAGAKLAIGLIANSIAVLSDAANNIADAISSVITLTGLRLSKRKPDPKHPFGYGRIEYLSGMIIAALVLVAGIEFLKESFERVRHPQAVDFAVLQLLVLGISAFGKFLLGRYNTFVGKKTQSSALTASGSEAMMDVLVSVVTIVTAIITKLTGWVIDGYVGILISVFILYTGVSLIRETISEILGGRVDKELALHIKREVAKFKPIMGTYDLILHNYGPVNRIGTLNLELPDTIRMEEAYEAMQKAQAHIYNKFHIYLTFGMYPVNTYDNMVQQVKEYIETVIAETPYALSMHALNVEQKEKKIRLDIVVDFALKDYEKFREEIIRRIQSAYPKYHVHINLDLDYS